MDQIMTNTKTQQPSSQQEKENLFSSMNVNKYDCYIIVGEAQAQIALSK